MDPNRNRRQNWWRQASHILRDFYSMLTSFHFVNIALDNEESSRVWNTAVVKCCLVLENFLWQLGKLALAGLKVEDWRPIAKPPEAERKMGRVQDRVCVKSTYCGTYLECQFAKSGDLHPMRIKSSKIKLKLIAWATCTTQESASSILGVSLLFVNTVLQAIPLHTGHSFTGHFHATVAELKSLDRNYVAHEAWNIYSCLFKKTFADSTGLRCLW